MLLTAAGAHRKRCHRKVQWPRSLALPLVWAICGFTGLGPANHTLAAEGPSATESLHKRIDRAVESVAIGPLAPVCSDADFVRRVYLDLTGVIPTADEVKAFLADDSLDKRAALIDRLVDSPAFSRHAAVQWSVVLFDRRTDKYVDQKTWETYLIDSIESRKPLDQIFRDLIFPDDHAEGLTPARKFLLNRDVEPHAMTRDVGRMLFGMDLQCAQCHDHPLVDDYFQADYFGLFAFFNRTTLFEDPQSKVGKLAEKADGEAPFESVFTGKGKSITRPRLPKGGFVYDEPRLPDDQAYKVKPDKSQAARPTFSRREALARSLTDNALFRRNVANRLWGMVMGRGLVHPSDFHYADNPPVNPELLALLADDWVASGFDLRHMMRQILRSKTYQRDCQTPAYETLNLVDIRFRWEAIRQEHAMLAERLPELRSQWRQTEADWLAQVDVNDKLDAAAIAMNKPIAEAQTASHAAEAELVPVVQSHQVLLKNAESVAQVLGLTEAAHQQLPDERSLADAIAVLQRRKTELVDAVAKSSVDLEAKTATARQAREALERLQQERIKIASQQIAVDELRRLEQQHLATQAELWELDAKVRLLARLMDQCRDIIDHADLVESDPPKAASLWNSIVDRWTEQGQIAPLKPLTPEQLAASMMQATGFLVRTEAAARAALEKTPPPELASADLTEDAKQRAQAVAFQAELLQQLRGNVNQFVAQFGGLAGEEFQATVNQALFLGNSPTVSGWLAPANGTLVGRLQGIDDVDQVAEELSFAVLSRPASADEQRDMRSFLTANAPATAEERTVALAEWVWAVITSNEFRFNH